MASSRRPQSEPAGGEPAVTPAAARGLVGQAEALARITLELQLRAVGAQARRVEADVRRLVARTADDACFRRAHERRLQEIWHELVAVRAHLAGLESRQLGLAADLAACRAEAVGGVVDQGRARLGRLRALADGAAHALNTLSPVHPHDAASPAATPGPPPERQSHGGPAAAAARRRIRETVRSTRRWHRDHKTTGQTEAQFTASYLKQQAKRDAPMAVLIQKALQKGLQPARRRPAPRSLLDLCQAVVWKDVTDCIEQLLVRDEAATVGRLCRLDARASGPASTTSSLCARSSGERAD